MNEELKPNLNWSPKDDPDYRPELDEPPTTKQRAVGFGIGWLVGAVFTAIIEAVVTAILGG
jgi:hypothetical protein